MDTEFVRRHGSIRSIQKTEDESQTKYVVELDDDVFMDVVFDYPQKKYYITLPKDQIVMAEGTLMRCYEFGALTVFVGASKAGKLATLGLMADDHHGTGEFEYIGSD